MRVLLGEIWGNLFARCSPSIVQGDDGKFQIGLSEDALGLFETRDAAASVVARSMTPPEMRSRRKGCHPCTGEVRNLEVQHSENAIADRQEQHRRRLFAFSLPLATTIAELAFAGGRR
jgi:hypothetical protein